MFIAGAIVALAGTAVSMYSQYRQTEQAQATINYNSRVAQQQAEQQAAIFRYNETVAQQQADFERQRFTAEAEAQDTRYRRVLASQRALYGAAGVQAEGTPLLVMLASEEEAALDVARIQHAGQVAAHGLQAEATLSRYRSNLARYEGGVARSQGRYAGQVARQEGALAMSSTLLSGLAQTAGIASKGGSLFGPTTGAASYSMNPGYQTYRTGERRY